MFDFTIHYVTSSYDSFHESISADSSQQAVNLFRSRPYHSGDAIIRVDMVCTDWVD